MAKENFIFKKDFLYESDDGFLQNKKGDWPLANLQWVYS